jgi:hypothetical protein
METMSIAPTGHAKIVEAPVYEIQRSSGISGIWFPHLRNLTQGEARALRGSFSGPEYRVVRIEVLDW